MADIQHAKAGEAMGVVRLSKAFLICFSLFRCRGLHVCVFGVWLLSVGGVWGRPSGNPTSFRCHKKVTKSKYSFLFGKIKISNIPIDPSVALEAHDRLDPTGIMQINQRESYIILGLTGGEHASEYNAIWPDPLPYRWRLRKRRINRKADTGGPKLHETGNGFSVVRDIEPKPLKLRFGSVPEGSRSRVIYQNPGALTVNQNIRASLGGDRAFFSGVGGFRGFREGVSHYLRLFPVNEVLEYGSDSQYSGKDGYPPIGRRWGILLLVGIAGIIYGDRNAGLRRALSVLFVGSFALLFLSGFTWTWGWWL